ncbi:hypothetical protein NMY22_g13727 [Coprinellus aureogranulatus]|nr:hypothetical protein NMY22_g13727 [Coprinellus aureogranulatus]
MFANSSHFKAGSVSQVNTGSYQGTASNSVTVNAAGQYTNNVEINAGVYNNLEVPISYPLGELYDKVAVAAMHNSEDRVDAPKCHPETRKAVQENIFGWISRGKPAGQCNEILWLTGPAGAGKTAIMGTVADMLEESGQLAASFYFSSYSSSTERKSKRSFLPS